jgi:hypothetical protein
MTTVSISESALSKTLPKRQLRPLKYGDEIVCPVHGGDQSKHQSRRLAGTIRSEAAARPTAEL